MSAAQMILDRLTGIKKTRPGRWIACCPAHEDKSPSLSIREMDDGRVLLYDFGGCDTQAVLDAMGLTLGDLFDGPLSHHLAPVRAGFSAREVLELNTHEALVVTELAVLARERPLTEEETNRLYEATARLIKAQTLT